MVTSFDLGYAASYVLHDSCALVPYHNRLRDWSERSCVCCWAVGCGGMR